MPLPQLSAVLNNCSLHALSPELKEEILKFSVNGYSNGHQAEYLRLKNTFAAFYELDAAAFTWQQFAGILHHYNAFDTQLILGPVLRLYMKEHTAQESTAILAIAAHLTESAYTEQLTEINETARYNSLSPEELFLYAASPLGFSVEYHPQAGSIRTLIADDAIKNIAIYHQGGICGAQAGGHWERTASRADRINFQAAATTQLQAIAELLGQDAAINPAGFNLLKKHVRLTLRKLTHPDDSILLQAFRHLIDAAKQIEKYTRFILDNPKSVAIAALDEELRPETRDFIEHYDPPVMQDSDVTQQLTVSKKAKKIFKQQLAAIAEKRDFFNKMRTTSKDYEMAYQAANTVYERLDVMGKAYFRISTKANYLALKNTFADELKPQYKVLEQHRGWHHILANIALAIAGLGVFYALAGAIHHQLTGHFMFFAETDSRKKITAIGNSIEKLDPSPRLIS